MIIVCPKCGEVYNMEEISCGQKVECICGEKWIIDSDEIYRFKCPFCGIKYEATKLLIGHNLECCCGNSWILEPKKEKPIIKTKKIKPNDNLTPWERKWRIVTAIQARKKEETEKRSQQKNVCDLSPTHKNIEKIYQEKETKYDYEKIEKAQEFRRKIETKKAEGFKHSGIINEQLSEILYLQQGGEEAEAEILLEKLLRMKELDSYYNIQNKNFEKTVTFLHIYDKARLFYERKKDYKNSSVYAAMTIYARILNLKNSDLYDDIDSVDAKYLNQLVKKLTKINSQKLYPEIILLIEQYTDFYNTIDNRNELYQQLDNLLLKQELFL